MAEQKKPVAAKWKISRLREHPQQQQVFGDLTEDELASLAENMRKNGLRDPVDILPDGTIIAGHQRVLAAKRLGWKEIDVVIRHDLADAGPEAIETYFVDTNLTRRQLSPLARARCIRRLMEIEEGQSSTDMNWKKKEILKDKVAKQMRLSPRSVSRYLLVLEAPIVVQQAFDRNEIKLIVAGKVALLTKAQQAEIVSSIKNGEPPAKAVNAILKKPSDGPDEAHRAFIRLISAFEREAPKIKGRVGDISSGRRQRSLSTLQEAKDLFSEILRSTKSQAS